MRLKYFSRFPTPAVAAPSCNCYLFYFFLLFEIYATEIKMQILRISLLVFCCYISSYRKSFLNHDSLFQWSLYFLPFSIMIHIFRWDWNWRFPAILQYSWCLLFNVSLCFWKTLIDRVFASTSICVKFSNCCFFYLSKIIDHL